MPIDPITGAALIGGAANLAGGIMGRDANRDANAANEAAALRNIELQREFAKNGLRWKVEDAKAAGIHPLYALGANTASFSPVSIGATADTSMPSAMSAMGQDISRAVSATKTADEKMRDSLILASAKADLDGKLIENQIRSKQLSQLGPTSPSFPGGDNFIPGQGNSNDLVKIKPSERTASQPGRLAQEAGWRPDVSFARTDTGLTPMIPEGLSESLEDDIIGSFMWRLRNSIMPNFTGQGKPAASQLPKGYSDWDYNFKNQEWRPVKGKGSYPLEKLRGAFRSGRKKTFGY